MIESITKNAMEEADLNGESRGKRRKKNTDCPETAGSPPHGVVIWDIDDTIVVIQASLKLHRNLHQLELVKSVKDYLTAYLDKEFYFCDTLHMNVVERLLDWEKETPIPVEADPQKQEQAEEQNPKKPPLPTLGNDIIANGSAYSTFLKSHYRTFQNEKIQSPPGTPKDLEKQTALCDDDKPKDKGFNIDHIYQRLPPGWRKIFNAMECKTLFWTEQAREVLSHLKKNNVRNMIVTASEIAPAVAKLIMWGLFEFFDIDDIYSSAKKPKTRVFQHLLEDLCADNHPPPQFVAACGDGPDEERAAAHFSIPFKKINSPADLYSVPSLLHADLAMKPPEGFPRYVPTVTDTSTATSPENLLLLQGEKEVLVDCNRQLLTYYSKVRLEVHESQSFGI